MIRTTLGAFLLIVSTYSVQANELWLDASNKAFNIRADATHATNGIIYSGSVLLTEDDEQLGTLGLWTHSQVGEIENLRGGLGTKIYGASEDDETFFALSIGGNIEYQFNSISELSLITEFFYAPEVTVSDDFDYLSDFSFRLKYQLFENAALYSGLRRIALEHESGTDIRLDNRLHAGINITF